MQAELTTVPIDVNSAIDAVQVQMMSRPAAECPVTHRFTNTGQPNGGMYMREIFMPAGSLIVSKIHNTQHPYVVLEGAAMVWNGVDGVEPVLLQAGHVGITEPGTRRVLYIVEDCRWITFHPTEKTTVEEIEADIIEPRYDHLQGLKQPSIEEFLAAAGGNLEGGIAWHG